MTRMNDPKLRLKEEQYLDGEVRKVVVIGKCGTYRVIYTAQATGVVSGGPSHLYQGEKIKPVEGEDLSAITACKTLYVVVGLAERLGSCSELYFETLHLAMKYIEEEVPLLRRRGRR